MGLLTDTKIKTAAPREKEYLLADGDGLYLRVRPTGKVWIYRYKNAGSRIKLGLGSYPIVSLASARQKARAEMEKRADGIDPKEARRVDDERERIIRLNTFELMARTRHCSSTTGQSMVVQLCDEGNKASGTAHLPLGWKAFDDSIAPTEIVRCLHRIKERGHLEAILFGFLNFFPLPSSTMTCGYAGYDFFDTRSSSLYYPNDKKCRPAAGEKIPSQCVKSMRIDKLISFPRTCIPKYLSAVFVHEHSKIGSLRHNPDTEA